ncbi:MAG: ABC transporter substrate-binding protein, partial [Stigonema ocellatum SAG 48.90 = DSM 106950]|nr:ABC transporter substrate-binding protein [Stigonema ocellatum SAG 48.90 = DSM 106950]
DSPIKTVADLKGKSVAFQRATASQYFVVKALQEAGLKLSDVKYLNLISPETRAAILRRSIDAGVLGDPQLAEFQRTVGVRILRDGKGITTQGGYYLAESKFVQENPDLVKIILEEINNVGEWAEAHPRDVAEIIARDAKLDIGTLETIVKRRRYTLRPITDAILSKQQEIADLFYEEKFINKKINVKDVALSAEQYAALSPPNLKP